MFESIMLDSITNGTTTAPQDPWTTVCSALWRLWTGLCNPYVPWHIFLLDRSIQFILFCLASLSYRRCFSVQYPLDLILSYVMYASFWLQLYCRTSHRTRTDLASRTFKSGGKVCAHLKHRGRERTNSHSLTYPRGQPLKFHSASGLSKGTC